MVPLSLGWGSAVLAAIATLAPSRAARSAIARPMPRLPPDTNSVLPLRDVMGGAPGWGRAGDEYPAALQSIASSMILRRWRDRAIVSASLPCCLRAPCARIG